MVNVGVIGLGPQWESGYRAALERLRSRIAVRAVYNAVESRAAQMAAVWKADPTDGIRALLERPDVRAVLVLDTAWHGTLPFEFVLASRKPAFLSLWPDIDRSMIEQLAGKTRAESLTLIPAFPRRYMPATARLRELIATRIGRPLQIRIQTGCPAGAGRKTREPDAPARAAAATSDALGCRPLLHVFDWCRQVVRTSPSSAAATPAESPEAAWAGVRRIEIGYRAPKEGSKCRIEIEVGVLQPGGEEPEDHSLDGPPLRIDVEAERGSATLTGPCTIEWSAGGDSCRESLTSERSEFEVMLDLFCRRVVGGLIPVADFGDIARGLALWSACEESLRSGGPVRSSRARPEFVRGPACGRLSWLADCGCINGNPCSERRQMRIPAIRGIIDRRILINYRVRPDALAALLPAPFRPKLVAGSGIAGICLIRLTQVRPRFVPRWLGLSSENAAHRIAVEWDEAGMTREGVYIPRRDTNSRWNALVGGRLFPGVHHLAAFTSRESADLFEIGIRADDDKTRIAVRGRVTEQFPASSVFASLGEASAFFESGSLGYSVTRQPGRFDGLELRCGEWSVEPLEVELVESSFFEDESQFPQGAVEFDCALLMRGIAHEWHGCAEMRTPAHASAAFTPGPSRTAPPLLRRSHGC